jgi:UDP-N-acetyl-D-mannosaminuronic acid dehydrogenase
MALPFKRVCVVGLGYIGLPTATVLASRGVEVVGVDVNPSVIATLKEGRIHIVEPELDIAVRAVIETRRLLPVSRPQPAEAFVIAVPTPFKAGYKPDLSYIEAAANSVAPVLAKGNLIILESTSPVGTTAQLAKWFAAARPDLTFPHQVDGAPDICIAYCPERVLPGRALRELVENDRVVGGMAALCSRRAKALYEIFVAGTCLVTNTETAEMVKLTENAFRDVNIAFANELSLVCDRLGIDVWELIKLANHHPRVNILQPGPGVGGHCISIDPWFIVDSAPEQARLIRTAREVNDGKPAFVVAKVRSAITAVNAKKPVVACLGLSFKADVDDLRESPALDIVQRLAAEGIAELRVAEPHIEGLPGRLREFGCVRLTSAAEALREAHVVLLLVNHKAFGDISREQIAGKKVIDTRGMWR